MTLVLHHTLLLLPNKLLLALLRQTLPLSLPLTCFMPLLCLALWPSLNLLVPPFVLRTPVLLKLVRSAFNPVFLLLVPRPLLLLLMVRELVLLPVLLLLMLFFLLLLFLLIATPLILRFLMAVSREARRRPWQGADDKRDYDPS